MRGARPIEPAVSTVSVTAGGLDHDQLVVRWGLTTQVQTLYLKDPAVIRAFRSAAPSDLTRHLDETAATVRRCEAEIVQSGPSWWLSSQAWSRGLVQH
jgi:hypothetical protein